MIMEELESDCQHFVRIFTHEPGKRDDKNSNVVVYLMRCKTCGDIGPIRLTFNGLSRHEIFEIRPGDILVKNEDGEGEIIHKYD